MVTERPLFMDSPYFVMEEDNWHLKPGAPAGIVQEFNEFMQADKEEKPVKKSFTDEINDILDTFPKTDN